MEEGFEKDSEGYLKLANLEDIAPGEVIQIYLEQEDWEVGIANDGEQIYAFRDVCPHQAFPLSVGRLNGCKMVCAGHNWEFDLKTGQAVLPPIRKRLELYPVKIDGNDIWVKVRTW